jgi:23S rRNA (pseudouridine1915-N3)-methyltransferase
MRLLIVAVGQRVPDWAQTAYDDYAKRFPPELKVELKAVKTETRGSKSVPALMAAERERIEAAIPRGARTVVLDERGTGPYHQGPGSAAAKLAAGGRRRGPGHRRPRMAWSPSSARAAHERIRLSDLTPAARHGARAADRAALPRLVR